MAYTSSEIFKRWLEPDFKFFINKKGSIAQRQQFLLEEDRMKGEYLGACLDYVRWGSSDSVMYEMDTKGMIEFINTWMDLNQSNLLWHEKDLPTDFDLPRINRERCSVGRHSVTGKDRGGRLRCMERECYSILSDEGVILPLEEVLDRLNLSNSFVYCFDSSSNSCSRLEEVPERDRELYKNSCLGHRAKETIHSFDGWTLAWYVQKWHGQDARAPVFN